MPLFDPLNYEGLDRIQHIEKHLRELRLGPPMFNVMEERFAGGAKGDGVADDTAAILAAIAAAFAVSGSGYSGATVFIPQGNFIVHKKISVPDGVLVRGAGKNSTLIRATYDGTTPVNDFQTGIFRLGDGSVTPVTAARLEDLAITGSAVCEVGVYTTQANEGCGLKNVRIRDCTQYFVRLSRNGSASPVADCKILDSVEIFGSLNTVLAGVYVEEVAGSMLMQDVSINMNGASPKTADGIKVVKAGNLVIVSPHIENCTDGIDVGTGLYADQSGVIIGAHTNTCTNGVHLQNAQAAERWLIQSLKSENQTATILDEATPATITTNWVSNYTIGTQGVNVTAAAIRSGAGNPINLGVTAPNGSLYLNTNGHTSGYADLWSMRGGNWLQYQTQRVKALAYSSSITPDPALGNIFTIVATNGTAFTINAPVSYYDTSMTLTFDIKNSSGGAHGAITWGAGYLNGGAGTVGAGAFAGIANGKRRTISFYFDGTNWIELFRTADQ